jgi:UDP:flavonoid glycosyltransferase YjiC (YdhE family)
MTKKILFVVGPALGHVARSLVVAEALASQLPLNIAFAVVRQGHGIKIISGSFSFYELPDMDRDCIKYADALETLLDQLSPDLVCLDLTPYPWLLQVRFPNILQVYLTNFFLTQNFRYTTHQELVFEKTALRVNVTRTSRGLAPIRNIKQMYDRDAVILCDPSSFMDSHIKLPPNYHVTGPCIWEPDVPLPAELAELNEVLFISFGSTGVKPLPHPFVEEIAKALSIQDVVWLGNKGVHEKNHTGLTKHHFYSWLPTSRVLPRSKFVITQGGAGSTYQALANGKPVGIWSSHQNQKMLGTIAQDFGCGVLLDSVTGMSQLVANDHLSMLSKSKELAQCLSKINGPMNAANVIARMLK